MKIKFFNDFNRLSPVERGVGGRYFIVSDIGKHSLKNPESALCLFSGEYVPFLFDFIFGDGIVARYSMKTDKQKEKSRGR